MAYCTKDNIASEFRDIIFDTNTAVTDTEVDDFCDQASALIDSYISSKYEVPVTGTSALLMLQMIAIWIVKARVISILSVKAPIDKTKQDPDSQKLYDQAIKLLEQIRKGTLILTDASSASSDDGMTSFLKDETVVFDFQTGRDNW